MRIFLLIIFFGGFCPPCFSQVPIADFPVHEVHPPVYRERVETRAYIDSALFARYLDWNLQRDSLPAPYRNGKPYAINLFYIVSKEGKIVEVRAYKNPEYDKDLFEYVQSKLLSIPYQWRPATQNGRAVNAYLRLRVVSTD